MTILVTVATKHGSTAEIAEAIGRELEEAGHAVTVATVESVTSVEPFEAVILGSGVYIGHWLAPARAFARAHAEELRARPTWLFSSGPIGAPPLPKAEDAVDVADLMQQTGAREHRLFGGTRRPAPARVRRACRAARRSRSGRRLPRLGGHCGLGARDRRRVR